jgi:hypothetical protein
VAGDLSAVSAADKGKMSGAIAGAIRDDHGRSNGPWHGFRSMPVGVGQPMLEIDSMTVGGTAS